MNRAEPPVLIKVWPILAVLGAVNLVVGLLALFWPGATLTVVGLLFGIQLLLAGAMRVILSLVLPQLESRWLGVLVGVFSVVVGLLVMREPLRTLEILVILVGVLWVVRGIVGLVGAVVGSPLSRTNALIEGAVSLAAGAVLLAWPAATIGVLTVVIGAALVLTGAVQLLGAFRNRDVNLAVDSSR
jgi:uncharacterized membrane protein HdeD (DUF308 family)